MDELDNDILQLSAEVDMASTDTALAMQDYINTRTHLDQLMNLDESLEEFIEELAEQRQFLPGPDTRVALQNTFDTLKSQYPVPELDCIDDVLTGSQEGFLDALRGIKQKVKAALPGIGNKQSVLYRNFLKKADKLDKLITKLDTNIKAKVEGSVSFSRPSISYAGKTNILQAFAQTSRVSISIMNSTAQSAQKYRADWLAVMNRLSAIDTDNGVEESRKAMANLKLPILAGMKKIGNDEAKGTAYDIYASDLCLDSNRFVQMVPNPDKGLIADKPMKYISKLVDGYDFAYQQDKVAAKAIENEQVTLSVQNLSAIATMSRKAIQSAKQAMDKFDATYAADPKNLKTASEAGNQAALHSTIGSILYGDDEKTTNSLAFISAIGSWATTAIRNKIHQLSPKMAQKNAASVTDKDDEKETKAYVKRGKKNRVGKEVLKNMAIMARAARPASSLAVFSQIIIANAMLEQAQIGSKILKLGLKGKSSDEEVDDFDDNTDDDQDQFENEDE